MKNRFSVLLLCTMGWIWSTNAQDTFSIVAVDSITGEVGSAGASCVDLFQTSLSTDDFLSHLIPGLAAINTQASYSGTNQRNATLRMNLGDTPAQALQWLKTHDVGFNPDIRQYGIAAMVNGKTCADAYTGPATTDYKNHIIGPSYAILGNILSGQAVLDSMEARFLRAEGDLACKLMAAMQGANSVGADSRCAANGTSSLFAFLKVTQPTNAFGSPSFLVSARTHDGDGIEPIDSLQRQFDRMRSCQPVSLNEHPLFDDHFQLYPNPAQEQLNITPLENENVRYQLSIHNVDGKQMVVEEFKGQTTVDSSNWPKGIYVISIQRGDLRLSKEIVVQ